MMLNNDEKQIMKAAVYTQYGPPEVVSVMDVPKPAPGEYEVLIKVYSSTVNRTDAGFRSAEYFISRFWSGLLRPKYPILGCEFAGVIVTLGNKVTKFKTGDKVFGFNDRSWGGHAEYVAIAESDAISLMPEKYSFDEAAALSEGAHYALVDIRAAGVVAGDEVMVYGATGAIGSAAVQLLKYNGAKVTAVCNSHHVELIRSLGADVVIDYQTQDYTRTDVKYDFILDAVGKSSFGICKSLLKDDGIYISTEFGKNGENIFFALSTRWSKGKKLLFPIPSISYTDTDLLKELAEKGIFRPVIDRVYVLDDIMEAYRYVDSGQKTGNVVLRIAE